jgi:hypothetical protein
MRGKRAVVAILVLFALLSAASVLLSTSATGRSKNRAAVIQVAAQRTPGRYVFDVLLKARRLEGRSRYTARLMKQSARPARRRHGARGQRRRRRDHAPRANRSAGPRSS